MRRILAIDGGGIKGVFPAAFLTELENHASPIGRYFDLICGTSTGGIIALGLAAGLRARDILDLYREHGKLIFPELGLGVVRWLTRPKYNQEPLRTALEATFGDRTLGDCQARVVIPTQHMGSGQVYIYKTPHHPDLVTDGRERLVDVALATSAAPTYFPAHLGVGRARLVDGGLWANNPAGVAAVEAVGKLGWARGEVSMLSLGCTEEPLANWKRRGKEGLAAWIPVGLPFFMAGQSSGALGMATVLLGSKHIVRCSHTVPPGTFELDRTDAIEQLEDLGHVEARKAVPRLLNAFLHAPAESFKSARRAGTQRC